LSTTFSVLSLVFVYFKFSALQNGNYVFTFACQLFFTEIEKGAES